MNKFKVKVTGVTPYMQHRMDDQKLDAWEKSRGAIIERDGLNTEKEKIAAYHSYIDEQSGGYYVPSAHFKQALINGGTFVKSKVGSARKSMKNIVAAMFFIRPEKIPFRPFDEVDTRSAVNKNNKARVIVNRPKWNEWNVEFVLEVDNDSITIETIRDIVEAAGKYIGVGSYRPEHTGEYGRFTAEVTPIKKQ